MCDHQNDAGQNNRVKIANKYLENVATLKYFGNDNNTSKLHPPRN